MIKNEKLFLKFPEMIDKDKWLDYVKEFREYNPNINPLGFRNDTNYEEWLSMIIREHIGKNLKDGESPLSVYFLMDEDRIIGNISIRHTLTNQFKGQIKYGVRPSERGNEYSPLLLNLALEKCEKIGLTNVVVTCKEDNEAVIKAIEENCGTLNNVIYDSESGTNYIVYSINVKEALDENNYINFLNDSMKK